MAICSGDGDAAPAWPVKAGVLSGRLDPDIKGGCSRGRSAKDLYRIGADKIDPVVLLIPEDQHTVKGAQDSDSAEDERPHGEGGPAAQVPPGQLGQDPLDAAAVVTVTVGSASSAGAGVGS